MAHRYSLMRLIAAVSMLVSAPALAQTSDDDDFELPPNLRKGKVVEASGGTLEPDFFQGLYVGFLGGFQDNRLTSNGAPGLNTLVSVEDPNEAGSYAFTLGYLFDLGDRLRFGLEGEVGGNTASAPVGFDPLPTFVSTGDPVTTPVELNFQANFSGTGSLGFLLTERFMIYGRGGYTYQTFLGDDEGVGGITYGGGLEIAFTDHWRFRFEALYTDFDRFTASPTEIGAGGRGRFNQVLSVTIPEDDVFALERIDVRGGFVYRF